MRITAEPRSDQWNADDFIGGPRTFTIAGVKVGTAEQKYDIALEEGNGRAWRPPLTMLRLLIAAWGDDASEWVGRRVTLYHDPTIRFGRDQVGGIRVSHLSHIDKTLKVALTETRGKKALHTVEPLPAGAPAPTKPTAKPFAQQVTDAVTHYETHFNVNQAQLEQHVGAPAGEWSPQHLASLRALAGELSGGVKNVDDVFGGAS